MKTKPQSDTRRLNESIALTEAVEGDSIFDENGCVPIHIIRPGIGKGRGRHLYEAKMLEANADKFAGWKMYIDHESPEARKAAGGLPRKTRDIGGRIVEAYWDPTVPADTERGYGAGAVIGKAKPVRYIKQLIEDDPELLEASISASATGVRPIIKDGQRVWLVEGIEDRGSVDWVSEGGAGGRVAQLIEAYIEESEGTTDLALVEALDDTELETYLRENRPQLALAEAAGGDDPDNEGGADMPISKEELQEALAESPDVLVAALAQSAEAQVFISTLVEAKVDEERDSIRAEAKAESERAIELRDFKDEAHKLISESKLPESWQTPLFEKFNLVEGTATADLDVVDDVDDDGEVKKPAIEKLRESVEEQIAAERKRLAEVSPTRVRNQGPKAEKPSTPEAEIKESEDKDPPAKKIGEGSMYRELLESAGVDVDAAYALSE